MKYLKTSFWAAFALVACTNNPAVPGGDPGSTVQGSGGSSSGGDGAAGRSGALNVPISFAGSGAEGGPSPNETGGNPGGVGGTAGHGGTGTGAGGVSDNGGGGAAGGTPIADTVSFSHKDVTDALTFADAQLEKTLRALTDSTQYDQHSNYPDFQQTNGTWSTLKPTDWTSGFLPGCMWYLYDWYARHQNTDKAGLWKARAKQWTEGIPSDLAGVPIFHDLGFLYFSSYGNGFVLGGETGYQSTLLLAAQRLTAKRDPSTNPNGLYDPAYGVIRDPMLPSYAYPVIIDEMMSLELPFWSRSHGGDAAYSAAARSHALKTQANHLRMPVGGGTIHDSSVVQLIDYQTSGAVAFARQGYDRTTTWSRGQAWAIYGFTMSYRETKNWDPNAAQGFLAAAEATADYFLNHLPSQDDKTPYWDFDVESIKPAPVTPGPAFFARDTSAAAIAISGLIELSTYVQPDRAALYRHGAKLLLRSLWDRHRVSADASQGGILKNGCYINPYSQSMRNKSKSNVAWDNPVMWGEYYFVEALTRWEPYAD